MRWNSAGRRRRRPEMRYFVSPSPLPVQTLGIADRHRFDRSRIVINYNNAIALLYIIYYCSMKDFWNVNTSCTIDDWKLSMIERKHFLPHACISVISFFLIIMWLGKLQVDVEIIRECGREIWYAVTLLSSFFKIIFTITNKSVAKLYFSQFEFSLRFLARSKNRL